MKSYILVMNSQEALVLLSISMHYQRSVRKRASSQCTTNNTVREQQGIACAFIVPYVTNERRNPFTRFIKKCLRLLLSLKIQCSEP